MSPEKVGCDRKLSAAPQEVAVSEPVPNEDDLISMLESDERSMSVVITNPALPDNPMIYISEEFEDQTGYPPEEVLGRNCRFLQGPETDPNAVDAIRAALKAQTTFTIDILNYRKSGEPFMNRLRIRPLFDDNGDLLYYVGAQNPV
jgi:PAS domain S-box-containing protein